MGSRSLKGLVTFMILGLGALPAHAILMSGPDIIAAPASVADDAPTGAENTNQQAFNEAQNVYLSDSLQVDNGWIQGTYVDSHMIFLNSRSSTDIKDYGVVWSFYGDILGVMSDKGGLLEATSNGLLGASGTSYPGSFNNRGLEGGGDGYTFSGNTITVSMHVTEPGDWIRVVTEHAAAPVPEPASMVLLGTGLVGLAGYRRRKISS